MNKTTKRNVVVSAVLAIMLCVSLMAGATFALFTSESKVNIAVTAGKVDVVATVENKQLSSTLTKGNLRETSVEYNENSNTITLDKIVPGDKVSFDIRIKNNSDVSVQYRTVIEKVSGDRLWSGLDVTIDSVAYRGETKKTEWLPMDVGSADIIVPVTVTLPEAAGNEYQGESCVFSYTVEAAQGNADMPSEWDGVTVIEPTKDAEGIYHVATASQLVYAMNASTPQYNGYQGNSFAFGKFVLESSIDFNGNTVKGFGSSTANFQGSFDGNGYTISNFTIDDTGAGCYGGLFHYLYGATVKDVIVKNANVKGDKQVGVLVGAASDNATVTGCKVYNSTVSGIKKVGTVVGYALSSTVKDCYAEECIVMYSEEEDGGVAGGGEVIGFVNTGCTTENNTFLNVDVIQGTAVTTDEALNSALSAGGNIYLNADAAVNGKTLSSDTTINLGGKTLELDGTLKLSGDADLTISGGTLSVDSQLTYIDVRPGDTEGGVVTFENVVFENTYKGPTYGSCTDYIEKLVDLWISNDNSNVVFKFVGCTFTNAQVAFRGAADVSGKFSATFENCTFTNFGVSASIEVMNYLEGTITVKDCTFNLTATGTQYAVASDNSIITWKFEGTNTVNGYAATASADIRVGLTPAVKVYSIFTNGSTVEGLDNVTVTGIATKN